MSECSLQEVSVGDATVEMPEPSSPTTSEETTMNNFTTRKPSVEFIQGSSLAQPYSRLRKIGGGECGAVWANPQSSLVSTDAVIKIANRGKGRSLANDYHVHFLITSFLENLSHPDIGQETRINFPTNPTWLAAENNDSWNMILPNCSIEIPGSDNALISERIPSLSHLTRVHLAVDFCLEPLRIDVLDDKKNEDFVVRPYLGRRRRQYPNGMPVRDATYSLRDFPLHVDQLEQIGLSTNRYARAMAEALSFLHWSAAIDAAGVEFVLAPDRPEANPKGSLGSGEIYKNDYLGDHCLWVTDFDLCQPMGMNDFGINLAVEAFYQNAPFYPRPDMTHEGDRMLWSVFRETYVRVSEHFLKGHGSHVEKLPGIFITQVELRANEFLHT